jgi:uncharacterized protein YjaZ
MQYTTFKNQNFMHKKKKEIEKKTFWDECQKQYERIRVAELDEEYNAEMKQLDVTLMDGIEDEY